MVGSKKRGVGRRDFIGGGRTDAWAEAWAEGGRAGLSSEATEATEATTCIGGYLRLFDL